MGTSLGAIIFGVAVLGATVAIFVAQSRYEAACRERLRHARRRPLGDGNPSAEPIGPMTLSAWDGSGADSAGGSDGGFYGC
ncbi:hypothetical protein GCM10023321_48340 [Pseudonocardia eucalypti]|uniref:Secreted protein n=1 Tax=Pseudonocardia eucalypti TaxID=648755 RepID=A0ABP9QIU9_9PSEU|nr:hypothetical protein [Pseudonocardia eucalypti]